MTKHIGRSILTLSLALLLVLSAIPFACAEEETECPFSLFVYDLPKGIKKPNEQAGIVHEEHYTAHRYSPEGEALEERDGVLYVYTPYGYDPNGEYDVIYLMHGAGETGGFWLSQAEYAPGGEKYNKAQCTVPTNITDNRIAAGECKPVILVAMTFLNQYGEGEDLYAQGSTLKLQGFAYEFRNEIVPCVEAKYATYAHGDVSPESLTASREHRAYAGFSMGSMTGWQAIWTGCVDYVAYIGNFSGCDTQGDGAAERAAEALNTKFADYGIKYWYNGNGTEDSLHDDHVAGYQLMLEKCPGRFTEGEDYANGCNTIFVDKPGKKHNYANWNVDLYNILSVFFKAN